MAPRSSAAKSRSTAAATQRQLRVGEEMRHALARIFERGELHDPALHEAPLTVTEVRVAPDLKRATAYVMPLGGRNAAEIMAGLKRGAGHLRRLVAQEVKLRVAPEIFFALDASFDEASRIEALLRREDVARDIGPQERGLDKGEDDGA
ncbi:MAG TPA: 30S ribosome-binding factor RbfA [Stellaceae bacterium]|nr:30S ribosome-binding factor RbfA [Stellaceae bacterium]